ncbi:hypothetical protein LshimejAT787_0304700 [Lyophyllum shimeji]|uniref:Uncharacterized protein n=1 Tax=Lyophyllum shimeji TaxID=47721 RepID=A0A9P3PIX3_LYOSH|nr:hypothetical protein LshimejAT787_0304700 [Lyophyllum shimeji]
MFKLRSTTTQRRSALGGTSILYNIHAMASPAPRQSFPELQLVSSLVEAKPESFASGSQDICLAALNATKFLFDLSVQSEKPSGPYITELLTSLEPSSAPRTRSQSNAIGQETRPSPRVAFDTTPLTSLFVDGMTDDQVWAQLDLRAKHICDTLECVLEGEPEEDLEEGEGDSSSEGDIEKERLQKALEALENGEDVDFDALRDLDLDGSISEDDVNPDESSEEDAEDGEVDDEEMDSAEDLEEGFTDLHDPSSDENEDDPPVSLNMRLKRKLKDGSKRNSELDDGFFDLATFNAETEQAEARTSSKGRLGGEEDSDDQDDVSIDLFAPLDDEEAIDEEGGNPGEAMYADFFEPPARPPGKQPNHRVKNKSSKATGKVRFHDEVRVKKIKAKGKNLPLSTMDDDDEEEEEEFQLPQSRHEHERMSKARSEETMMSADDENSTEDAESQDHDDDGMDTIARFKDDLFAEEGDNSPQDLSTHEKRILELREQIAALEKENVGPKDWVLMGEAGSRARPQNSLLEEDLEFERAMKAVPVITEETVQVLEERIKARILEGRFDDVVRLRPVDDKPFLPSRLFELKDTKSAQSLAQIYEDEYIASQTGGVAGEDRDGKLKREHEEIERLWEGICYKLDALCNAHFMPKQPKATISTVANVSAATLESALPTTKSVSTMLAPEEVFSPSAETRARSELTPSEKRALYRRERKAKKKSRDALEKNVDKYAKVRGIGGVKQQKRAALESLVKSGKGITVVGKPRKESSRKHGSSKT